MTSHFRLSLYSVLKSSGTALDAEISVRLINLLIGGMYYGKR